MKPIYRSILAVAAGFVFIAALSFGTDAALLAAGVLPAPGTPIFDTKILLLVSGYVAVYAIAGCWLTAALAPDRPMRHALIEGALGLAFTILAVTARWNLVPVWYSVVSVVTVMPYAWIGGRLREMQVAARADASAVAVG
jgi:hypothetical protein